MKDPWVLEPGDEQLVVHDSLESAATAETVDLIQQRMWLSH